MAKLRVSLAVAPYDRTRPILDGRVTVDGCEIVASALEPEEMFFRAYRYQDFDITELSLSTHLLTTARGDAPFVGIPAFLSRSFRHASIIVRTDRGIRTPADLKGKTVGLPEYQQTANVWVRGMLKDEYGVDASDVRWRGGGMEEPGRAERTPITLPPPIDLQRIPSDRTLSQMLATGELDAVMGPRPPSYFGKPGVPVARLFPDYRAAEEAYFKKARMFPIMHILGIRKTLHEQHPWLAANIYKAFVEAKKLAVAELQHAGRLAVTLPWLVAEYQATRALMGDDYWSYGVAANRREFEALGRYAVEQGLAARPITPEELFAPSTLQAARV
ncbi:MAG: ABC transporter substrate-binding protein [Alphaproteobacteria bacterium]|nr:ABC transporter substrate-binding protein [Alphaproteobacteria bacterium]